MAVPRKQIQCPNIIGILVGPQYCEKLETSLSTKVIKSGKVNATTSERRIPMPYYAMLLGNCECSSITKKVTYKLFYFSLIHTKGIL
jgi:hypothetical protein